MPKQNAHPIPFSSSKRMPFTDKPTSNALTLIARIDRNRRKIDRRNRLTKQAHLVGREQDVSNHASIDLSYKREFWVKSTPLAV
jgi:hypothetical protein